MPRAGVARRPGTARFRRVPPGPGGPYNSTGYLNTPTPDGTGKGTHCDVLHVSAGLFGYAYWMAFTPFAGSDSAVENPCILVSTDGLAWSVPPGLTNPIDPAPSSGYNSDPDLLLGQDGVLYCFYRSTGGTSPTGDVICCRYSSDGVTWSAEQQVLVVGTNDGLSPTVLWDGTQYVMYVTNDGPSADGTGVTIERRTCATPLGTWSAPTTCTYAYTGAAQSPWHIDAFLIGTKTCLLVNEGRSSRTMTLASAADGVTFTRASTFMSPLPGNWDSTQIYRGCVELHPNGTDLRIWYSAQGASDWRIGYTTAPRSLVL